jgi:hypothetical protein
MKTQEYICSIDTGRNQWKYLFGLLGAKPMKSTEVFSCCPVKPSIDSIEGNLHVRYQGKEWAFGKEASVRYGTAPDTSDNPYIVDGDLSPGYYACMFGGIEKLVREYKPGEKVDLHLTLTLPEQHLSMKDALSRLLSGKHLVEFDNGVRAFNILSLYLIHQPKGILYCHQYILCDNGKVRMRQIDEGTRINATDLGSETVYNSNYTWFKNDKGKWGWDCPKDEFRQDKKGHWSLLERYRHHAHLSTQEDVWRIEKKWKKESQEVKQAVIAEHISALNILNNQRYCDDRIIGGGGYYDLAGYLPFEAVWPESYIRKPEFFQCEGNWKLLHYLVQTTGGTQ